MRSRRKLPRIKKADEEPEKEQEFNLEDTILAAASEQGINIPEEEKSPDVQQSEVTEETEDEEDLDIAADEFVPESRMQRILRISWHRFPHSRQKM